MTLFQILSFDERFVVLSLQDDATIYTWNRSNTLQCWRRPKGDIDSWEEVGIQNLSTEPKTFEKARIAAIDWSLA